MDHSEFLRAISELHEVQVRFISAEDDGATLVRRCAPMDYGPSSRAEDKSARYHFMDFDSDSGKSHTLSLLPEKISGFEVLETHFDPASFVTWKPKWLVARTTWGRFN
jgi:hypothetical protein